MHFTKINLAATGSDGHKGSCFAHGDISAIGFQLSDAFDLSGANVSATCAQFGAAGNVADHDVSASGLGVKITGNVLHADVTTLALEFCYGIVTRGYGTAISDATGSDVAAFGLQRRRPPMFEVRISPAPWSFSRCSLRER